MFAVDVNGDNVIDELEVYNIIEQKDLAHREVNTKNRIMAGLVVFVLCLITITGALAFVAVDLGRKVDVSGGGETLTRGGDTVVTGGASVRNFKLADLPSLSYDYLEQAEKITVLFDARIHHFAVASFEWIGTNEAWVHMANDQVCRARARGRPHTRRSSRPHPHSARERPASAPAPAR